MYILYNCRDITPITVGHASKTGQPLYSTLMGDIDLLSEDVSIMTTSMYFCTGATGTIISPDFIFDQSQGTYNSFDIHSNIRKRTIWLRFVSNTGSTQTFAFSRSNGLWYLSTTIICPTTTANTVNRLSVKKQSYMCSLLLGSTGERQIAVIPKHTGDLPSKIVLHNFHHHDTTQDANISKVTRDHNDRSAHNFGDRLHMDFSFMRALSSSYKHKKGDQRIIQSRKGYKATLTITEAAKRRVFSFPTAGKKSPCKIVEYFIELHGKKSITIIYIIVYQGGELTGSHEFQEIIAKHGYVIEPTGSDASSENGKGERQHRTLITMVRRLLYKVGLPPPYWADALLHDIYL